MKKCLALCLLLGLCSGVSVAAEEDASTVITRDMVPEDALYDALTDMDGDEAITLGDAALTTDLWIEGDEATAPLTLKGLELCTSLESLTIVDAPLSAEALTTIATLRGLTSLTLTGDQITDWSALTALDSLDTLDLSDNLITDLSPVDTWEKLPLMIVTNNRLNMDDVETLERVKKLEAAAVAKIPQLMDEIGDSLDDTLAQLEDYGVTLDVEKLLTAILPMMINTSQLPKDGELLPEGSTVNAYVYPMSILPLLSAITLPPEVGVDVESINAFTQLLMKSIDNKLVPFSTAITPIAGNGAHIFSLALDKANVLEKLNDLIAGIRADEEMRAAVEELLFRLSAAAGTPNFDDMTAEELFEMFFFADEDGDAYYYEEFDAGFDEPLVFGENVFVDGSVLTLPDEELDMRKIYNEMFSDGDELSDEKIVSLFVRVDAIGNVHLFDVMYLLDENGDFVQLEDAMDENGVLTDLDMDIHEFANMMYGGNGVLDQLPALPDVSFPMDEDGYLLDENGKQVLGKDGKPIKAVDAALDALAEVLPKALSSLDQALRAATERIFYIGNYGKPGDVNFDTKVDSTDARLVLQSMVMKYTFNSVQERLADVDKNDTVDSQDARQILKASVGKITLE